MCQDKEPNVPFYVCRSEAASAADAESSTEDSAEPTPASTDVYSFVHSMPNVFDCSAVMEPMRV